MESLLSGMGALSLRPASLSSRAAVRGSPLVLRGAHPCLQSGLAARRLLLYSGWRLRGRRSLFSQLQR